MLSLSWVPPPRLSGFSATSPLPPPQKKHPRYDKPKRWGSQSQRTDPNPSTQRAFRSLATPSSCLPKVRHVNLFGLRFQSAEPHLCSTLVPNRLYAVPFLAFCWGKLTSAFMLPSWMCGRVTSSFGPGCSPQSGCRVRESRRSGRQ